jgi:hypothetical protein
MTPVPDIRAVRQDVPQELLDIIYCSLNKAPEDRFTTTREMAQALENVPQSDSDREEAEKMLKELSAGRAIPKIRTGTLPPLHLTISGPAAPVVPRPVSAPRKAAPQAPARAKRRKKKKNKLLLPLASMILLIGGAGAWLMYQQNQQDKITAQNALAMKQGSLVITGLPSDTLQVLINQQLYKNGDTLKGPSGNFAAQANLAGYTPLQRIVTVPDSGKVETLDLTMEPLVTVASAAPPTAVTSTSSQRNSQSAPSSSVKIDSGQVRMKVIPSYAEMFIDGKSIGTNFKTVGWPAGRFTARFQAPGCGVPIEQPIVVKKGELLIVPAVTISGC